jgi:hypothetical protein
MIAAKWVNPAELNHSPGPTESNDFATGISIPFEPAESDSARTIESIHKRAATVTPLLEEILMSRPPSHWGLND